MRYRLSVGDQLVYEYRSAVRETDDPAPRDSAAQQIRIWCLQRTANEALLLIDLLTTHDGRMEPVCGMLVYLDDSGRRRWPDEIPPRLAPFDPALDLLPALPLAVESTEAWDTPPDLFGRRWHCQNRGPDAAERGNLRVEFRVSDTLAGADFRGPSRTGRYWFDPACGTVARFEAGASDAGPSALTRTVATLRHKLTHTVQWASRRSDEADRFLRTLRHEDRLLHDVLLRPEAVASTLSQLDRLWATFKSDIDTRADSPFGPLADGRRQQLGADAERLRAQADLAQRWLGQPARPWSLQNPAGQTITSESARQGVVIECFWSAASPWGPRALEAFRHLTNPPIAGVRLLCYNMDAEVEFARAACQRYGSGLNHILGGPLQVAEPLPEFPIVRVLDRSGRVRDLWIGWQPAYAAARNRARELAAAKAPG